MTIDDVRKAVDARQYETKIPDGTVAEVQARIEDRDRLEEEFESDMKEAAVSRLGCPLSEAQWASVYGLAWEQGHAYGLYQIVSEVELLLDVVILFVSPPSS